jgi:hypothetical protein
VRIADRRRASGGQPAPEVIARSLRMSPRRCEGSPRG